LLTWKQKIGSRKFVLAVATFVSALLVIFLDVEIEPGVLVGAAAIISTYIGGQSWIDKSVVQGNADVMKNESLLQAQAYIKYLEAQLQAQVPQENVVPFPTEEA